MKTLAFFLILNIVLSLTISSKLTTFKSKLNNQIKLKTNQLPVTPKANDLNNHYGTKPQEELYGPKANLKGLNLKRAGHSQGEPISPISNFNEELDPEFIASGDLSNTSADASLIIKAPIVKPKVIIHSKLIHDAVVKTPVHIGNEVEKKKISILDRGTGKVTVHNISVSKPILSVLNTAKEIVTPVDTVVDLKSGNIIKSKSNKVLLGVENNDIIKPKTNEEAVSTENTEDNELSKK